MKILSLILDGHGRLSAELCVSPDLKRREIVVATGGGDLIWCGLAANGQKPSEVLDELQRYLKGRKFDRRNHAALRGIVRKAHMLTVIAPCVDRMKGWICRSFRRSL